VNLQSVNASGLALLTTAQGMFYGCGSLNTVNITGMVKCSAAIQMFYNCYTLKSIIGSETFGSNAVSVDGNVMLNYVECVETLDFSGAKFTAFTATGESTSASKLTSILFNPSSTFSSTSSPQINISYCSFSAELLNTLFTSLPTVTSKTIRITGNPGAATCNKTIANSKGWTVT
jgi:hypothetical protein